MTYICAYCGTERGEPWRGCCGEVHFHELDDEQMQRYEAGEEVEDILRHPGEAPDYRMPNEYYPDKARARKRREVWGD